MAKPQYYPDWATQTVILPGTGKTNKVRPKETIRNVGMDFSQIMTCEELNWILNNYGLWVRYIVDEFFPTLPNTYLPLKGTKITLSGDAKGSVTWNGNKEVTLDVTVLDNSHKHLSADISDATSTAVTPNVLVKRDTNGGIYAGDIYTCATHSTDAATVFMRNFDGKIIGNISSHPAAGGTLTISRLNPTTGAGISLALADAGYTAITNPRSNSAQETGNGAALVRLDYLNTRLQTLQNTITSTTATFVKDIRLGSAYTKIIQSGLAVVGNSGGVTTGWQTEGSEPKGDTIFFRPIQKLINGTWYTVGQL